MRRPGGSLLELSALVLAAATGLAGCRPEVAATGAEAVRWRAQASGTAERLQAVSVVDHQTVWVSGIGGTVAVTGDGGDSWNAQVVAGGEELQFRDIHAVSAAVVYLLAAGPGESSRILKTVDGGRTWDELWRNREPKGFLDCFSFWDGERGLAFGDSVDGGWRVLRTVDGESWQQLAIEEPPPLAGEGGFAASGTCLVTADGDRGWIGTGAGGAGRVLRTADAGVTWEVSSTPIYAVGQSAGITTLLDLGSERLLALGGDVVGTATTRDRSAISGDGGVSWRPGGELRMSGAPFGSARVRDLQGPVVVAVGPGGLDLSRDGGASWRHALEVPLWSVAFASRGVGWAVGPDGAILRLEIDR